MIKHLTAAMCLGALVFAVPPAMAEPRGQAAMGVRLSDLDLTTEEGVHQLAERFKRRFWSICGTPHETMMTYVMTGGGLEERAACKAKLGVSPDTHPAVRRAFALALERMR